MQFTLLNSWNLNFIFIKFQNFGFTPLTLHGVCKMTLPPLFMNEATVKCHITSKKKSLDYIIFDILNQFNLLRFWPITPWPKLGLAIINFKQKLTILSSFPLILNHCSISIGKNQLIPHVIANNHKNARTDGRIDWSQSMQRDPCNGKLACFDREMMTQWKIQKSSS